MKVTGKTRQTVSQYCNGVSEPGYSTLVKIADHFDVSIDYLLGRQDLSSQQMVAAIDDGSKLVAGLEHYRKSAKKLSETLEKICKSFSESTEVLQAFLLAKMEQNNEKER